MKVLEVKHIKKSFNDNSLHVLKDISFDVNEGEVVSIIGPSGSGKSTLLRCATLLNDMDSGELCYNGIAAAKNNADGKSVYADKATLKKIRGYFGLVFQNFNLFPHYSVMKNLTDPQINVLKRSRAEAEKKAQGLLEQMGLSDKADAYPCQLSGGQQQRVAIARALATHPKILLCDEATSALDPQTTQSILSLIRDIHDKLGITVIVITHQMSVVEQICTRVAILDHGTVVEEGKVSDVFSAPKSDAAKSLVYPDGCDFDSAASPDESVIRVVFNGAAATNKPLIAQMAIEENISADILSASTRSIGGKAYGNMLLGIPGGKANLEKAMNYLKKTPDIYVEEVTKHAE